MSTEKDYVLGTHDEEVARLGLQHRIWRPRVSELWRRVGIRPGVRIIDIGAGPGFATADLAEIVAPGGAITAVERSARYLQSAKDRCARQGSTNVTFLERDLMTHDLDVAGMDFAWCRWVASFVSDVPRLVAQVARALRPGGIALFHEYIDYHTLRLTPRRPAVEEFVREVVASWRDQGGEPDVAVDLPTHLVKAGFSLTSMLPVVYAARPSDFLWQWPASFIDTYVYRLADLGRVDRAWAERVRKEFHDAENDPAAIMITPMLLEIVAEKRTP